MMESPGTNSGPSSGKKIMQFGVRFPGLLSLIRPEDHAETLQRITITLALMKGKAMHRTILSTLSLTIGLIGLMAASAKAGDYKPAYVAPPYKAPCCTPPAYNQPCYKAPSCTPSTPPYRTPPAYTPPAYTPPPAYMPPAYTPPAYTPPVYTPPVCTPPCRGNY
jgi:hypothetical protein